ncbi:peptide transporter family 1-like [Ctenocephalides felis]|uniref:peptide transporter family 1-like n=1 Tax=Ctenocephalides felis TaxID=7515 RepID=UPI000E6E5628|nr:peptide transporter family 1-like [Ctenocephalides felis]
MSEAISEPEQPKKVSIKSLPKGTYFLLAQTFPVTLGMFSAQSIYSLYIRNKLGFGTDTTVAIIHGTKTIISVFFPIGALISSSFANRFIILVFGDVWQTTARSLLFIGSFPPMKNYARQFTYAFWALHSCGMIIMAGTFPAFEGDQFELPEQHDILVHYYRIDYIFRSSSVLLAYFLLPLLKSEVPCMGDQECYPIPFGVSIASYMLEISLLVAGYKFYTIKKPTTNMSSGMVKCVRHALKMWSKERKTNPKEHWLDYSKADFGEQMVSDIKTYLRILLIMVTIPTFYSMYNQVNTKWLFQAARMDGRIGSYTIIPDHFLLLNPTLVLVLLPVTMNFIDPYILRFGMDRSLRRMIFGGTSLAIAFAISGIIESRIKIKNPDSVQPPANQAEMRFYNGLNCSYVMYASDIFPRGIVMSPLSIYTAKHIPMHGHKSFNLSSNSPCATFKNKTVFIEEQASVSVFINTDEVKGEVEVSAFIELDKSESGLPHLTVLGAEPGDQILVKDSNAVKIKVLTRSMHTGDIYTANSRPRVVEVTPDEYSLVRKGGRILTQFDMHLGGAYAAILYGDSATFYEIREPNSVHILWLLPQAIIYSIGEIYFMIAWQDFKYTQAPATLKSVVCATAEFCEGIGDAIVVIVTFCATFDQDHEFFLFSGLLIIDMILLVIIGIHFKPQDPTIKLI